VTEGELITLLASLGIDEHNYRVLPLLPLVHVAWADKIIQDEERSLIMDLAENRWFIGDEGALLLKNWLAHCPSEAYIGRGQAALIALTKRAGVISLGDNTLDDVLELSRAVAEAAGGFFGLGAVSREEASALASIASILRIPPGTSWSEVVAKVAHTDPLTSQRRRKVTINVDTSNFDNGDLGGVLEPDLELGMKIPLARGLVMGAAPDCDVLIEGDPHVEPVHAEFYSRSGKHYVEDIHSRTGTWVDGERIVERRLLGGEKIRVGEVSFTFKLERKVPAKSLTD